MAGSVALKFQNIKPKIGSIVLNGKAELLGGVVAEEINDLLEQRGVLVFPRLGLTADEQKAFTNRLGRLAPEVYGQEIYNISLDPKVNPRAEYLKGSLYWHIDGTMNKVPIRASILTSRVLPTWGGNTEFCNTYSAYDDLPENEKAKLEGLRVLHAAWASLFYYEPEPSQSQLESLLAMGEIELPLVWKHKSGRKSLVLGCSAHHIIGMSPTQSTLLLNRLREWSTSEPYHYTHEWSVGDTVMWDNTGTMHRARPYDPKCGRLLHRTILQGDEPMAA